ncbi:hypothetical protein Tco_0533483 [Tanacetum coccineum]
MNHRELKSKGILGIIEDLALYDNESWNYLRDFAKPVKAITLPQDVPSTSDRRLIELENQVQRLMEAHLAPTQPTQVNKVTTSCEICSGPHDTQYCMEDLEQAFVEYASARTDKAGDARLSKFKANFKQQQSKMTNKINTVLKAITDRIAGALPSDTVKNPKLSTSSVLSARSYPTIDPQCSSHPSTSINAIKAHSKEANISQTSLLRPGMEIELQQPEEPEPTLEEDLELGKNGSTSVKAKYLPRWKTPGYLLYPIAVEKGITRTEFCVKGVDLGEEEAPYWTTLGKKESYKPRPSSDGVGTQIPYYARKDFLDCHLPREWGIARDVEINHFNDVLVFRRIVEFLGAIPINLKSNMWESEDLIKNPINWNKPPKNGDGAWHAKIRLIDPDGEEFTKTLQPIPTTRKLSERESPREIIDLDRFYDT